MNTHKSFSFKEAYKFSANATIEHFGILLKFALLWIAISIGTVLALALFASVACIPFMNTATIPSLGVLPEFVKTCFVSTSVIPLGLIALGSLALLSYLFTLLEFQLLRLAKAYYEKKSITLSELFSHDPRFFKFWAARALFLLKVLAGFILLIIPGIYITYTYLFSGYSIFDGVTDEIGEDAHISANLSHKVKWRIFAALILPVLVFAGSRGLYVLVATPINIFILFSIYTQLKEQVSTTQDKITAS